MRIKVTKVHIGAGVKESADRCPVALAVATAGAPCSIVVVDTHEIKWCDLKDPDLQWSQHLTPSAVKEFIEKFDAGKAVKPFAFTL